MSGALGAKMEYVDTETIWPHAKYDSFQKVELESQKLLV
jgi:hypothetical protein